MLNNIKVVDSFYNQGILTGKNTRSADKKFQKHKSLKCHQTAIHRLAEIPKTTEDVSTTLKNNLRERQCEKRASWQRLPFRGHGDDKDSNFKELLDFLGEDNLALAEWLKKKESNLHLF